MKKGNTFYLWIIIVIFIVLWIPFFQNAGGDASILFFNFTMSFTALYPWMLFFGVVEGFLITIYLKSLVDDLKKDEPKKFDL